MLIALPVNKAGAMKSHWFSVKIAFNLKQDEITLKIHEQEKVCKGVALADEFSPKIVFGKSDHIIDAVSYTHLSYRKDDWRKRPPVGEK